MKIRIKKILSYLPSILSDYFEWIFCDAAENQIERTKAKKNKFTSYTQLKKHQRRIKLIVGGFCMSLFFLLVGLMFGPILFPPEIASELYIPNGKGDILLGNVSKNQATVIFKTLDSANENKPLATKAFVEFFNDKELTDLVRRSAEDEYAVTHIVPVDSLQEGKNYYIRITAKDFSTENGVKVVSSWGEGNDPINVFTAGELINDCASPEGVLEAVATKKDEDVSLEKNEAVVVTAEDAVDDIREDINTEDVTQVTNPALHIANVMNENYLQPGKKVQTIISWDTNREATTALIYGESNSKEKKEIVFNEQLQKKHAAILTTFKVATTYYFQVKSVDKDGNVEISEEYSLRTPKPQSTVVEQIAASFRSIFRQIKPN